MKVCGDGGSLSLNDEAICSSLGPEVEDLIDHSFHPGGRMIQRVCFCGGRSQLQFFLPASES